MFCRRCYFYFNWQPNLRLTVTEGPVKDTPVQKKRFWLRFFQQSDSNPGELDEKRERYLRAQVIPPALGYLTSDKQESREEGKRREIRQRCHPAVAAAVVVVVVVVAAKRW